MPQRKTRLLTFFVLCGGPLTWLLAVSDERTVTYEMIVKRHIKRFVLRDAQGKVVFDDPNPQRRQPPLSHYKCWIKGNKFRSEEIGDRRLLELDTPEGHSLLEVKAKRGYRTPASTKLAEDIAHRDPTRKFASYSPNIKKRMTHEGTEEIDGQICNRYQWVSQDRLSISPKIPLINHTHRIWVRRKDSVVVKIELESEDYRYVTEYKNIKVGVTISDSLFEVPKDYTIEDRTPKR